MNSPQQRKATTKLSSKVVLLAAVLALTLAGTVSAGSPSTPDNPGGSGQVQPNLAVQPALAAVPNLTNYYHPLATGCRVVDTRVLHAILNNNSQRAYPVAGVCGIPANATAVQASLSAVSPTGGGFLRAWANGLPEPANTVLQYSNHIPATTGAVLSLGSDGKVKVHNYGGPVNLVIDASGYYTNADETLINILGGIYYGGQTLISASRTTTGEYSVTFNHPLPGCAVVATPWSTGTAYYATVDYLTGATVHIHMKNSAGAATNAPFTLSAVC